MALPPPEYTGPLYTLHVHLDDPAIEDDTHYTLAFWSQNAINEIADTMKALLSLPTFSYAQIEYYSDADVFDPDYHPEDNG